MTKKVLFILFMISILAFLSLKDLHLLNKQKKEFEFFLKSQIVEIELIDLNIRIDSKEECEKFLECITSFISKAEETDKVFKRGEYRENINIKLTNNEKCSFALFFSYSETKSFMDLLVGDNSGYMQLHYLKNEEFNNLVKLYNETKKKIDISTGV